MGGSGADRPEFPSGEAAPHRYPLRPASSATRSRV